MLIENLRGCMNFDGGFGSTPGGESHGGQSGSLFLLLLLFFCFTALPRIHLSSRFSCSSTSSNPDYRQRSLVLHSLGSSRPLHHLGFYHPHPIFQTLLDFSISSRYSRIALTTSLGLSSSPINPQLPPHSRHTNSSRMAIRTSTPLRRFKWSSRKA
jgi:hypothetical protein